MVISNQLPVFNDGVHVYQIKVTDNAGNVTETSALPLMVDTVPPAIAMEDDSLSLGDTLMYDLEDTLSGLWISRSVIEDDGEKYKKIVWLEELTGAKSNDNEIRWNGVFADGTKAAPGEYFITLKISDQAGNETMRTAIVEVTAFNSLLPIPAFEPPASLTPSPSPSEKGEGALEFGGANNGAVGAETTTSGGETVSAGARLQTAGTSSFTAGSQTTTSPISNPNILWGAAAAALLGATLAEWQKKREEEAARLAALRNSGGGEEEEEGKRKSPGRIKYEAMMRQKRIVGELQAAQNEKARQPVPNAREAAMLRREFIQSGHVPPASKPPRKPAANKREEAEERRAFAKSEQAANAIPSKPAVEETRVLRAAGAASVTQGKQEVERKTSWWENWGKPVLTNVADFMSGVAYQATIKNNLDPLMAIAPAPKDVKNGWYQSWAQLEIDSTAFIAGRIVGGIVGIIQGVWEMASGVATGTGGTIVSCGTVVLCVGGGGASIAAGSALVTHGAVVLANSAYQTGQQIQALMSANEQNNIGNGRPGNNIAQNRQFDGAVREIEKQIGRKLTKNERRQLHDSLHHLENPGYWDIVEEGLNIFGE